MNNFDKLFDSTAYVLYLNGKTMNYTKLIKELYFSDKESFTHTVFSITGDKYYCMKEGSVLSTLYYLIKGKHKNKDLQNKWNEVFSTNFSKYEISINFDNFTRKSLSPFEKRTLKSISNHFKEMDWKDVVDNYAHNPEYCPEWELPKTGRKILPLESIKKSIGFSEEATKVAVKENNYYLRASQK